MPPKMPFQSARPDRPIAGLRSRLPAAAISTLTAPRIGPIARTPTAGRRTIEGQSGATATNLEASFTLTFTGYVFGTADFFAHLGATIRHSRNSGGRSRMGRCILVSSVILTLGIGASLLVRNTANGPSTVVIGPVHELTIK